MCGVCACVYRCVYGVCVHGHIEARVNFACSLDVIHLGLVCLLDKAPH